MEECRGTVLSVEAGHALVQPDNPANCRACAEGRGCGGGLFARALAREGAPLSVENRLQADVGDCVVLGTAGSGLLSAALLVYLMPLLALLAGAGLGQLLGGGDAPAMLGGGLGLATGFALLRFGGQAWLRRHTAEPKMLRLASVKAFYPVSGTKPQG